MTGRVADANNQAELVKPAVVAVTMVDLDFASGHLYANDGFTEILWNGNTFLPTGEYGGIHGVEEELGTIARPLELTLSGVDAALIAIARTENYQNREAIIYAAWLGMTDGLLVGTPEIYWEGRMDYMRLSIDQGRGEITLNCEHRLRREPRHARYTDADQQARWPGDTGLAHMKEIQSFISGWGDAKAGYVGPSPMLTALNPFVTNPGRFFHR